MRRIERRAEIEAVYAGRPAGLIARALVEPARRFELRKSDFHDIVAGSTVKKAYQDARDDQGYATSLAKEIVARGLQLMAQQVDTAQGHAGKTASFLLFNAHAWPVRE